MDLAEANHIIFNNSQLILQSFFNVHKFNLRRGNILRYYSSTAYGGWRSPSSLDKGRPSNHKFPSDLDPNWVTGFTDAEGCFTIKIYKSPSHRFGWRIQPEFSVLLHKRDEILLNRIKQFLGVGVLYTDRDYLDYNVRSLKDLTEVVIPNLKNIL